MNKKTQLIVLTLILIVVLGGAGILYSRLSAGAADRPALFHHCFRHRQCTRLCRL